MYRQIVLFFLLCFSSIIFSPLIAQNSIETAQVKRLYNIGSIQPGMKTDVVDIYNIGKTGGENEWDFSNIQFRGEIETVVLDPITTTSGDLFPMANRVVYGSGILTLGALSFIDGNDTIVIEDQNKGYRYFEITDTAILEHGAIIVYEDDPQFDQILLKYDPPVLHRSGQLNYNKIMRSDGDIKFTITSNGFSRSLEGVYLVRKSIDAFGNIQLPNGQLKSALRFRDELVINGEEFGSQGLISNYRFITSEGDVIAISSIDDAEAMPTEGTLDGVLAWGDMVKVNETTSNYQLTIDPEIEFNKVFPNPIDQRVNINFTNRSLASIVIDIYDFGGQIVMNRNLGQLSPGKHSISMDTHEWPSGQLLIFLRSPNGVKFTTVIKSNE